MGFYNLKKAKDEDKKVLNCTEMTLAIKESTDKMMTSMIGDMLAINGASLEEVPEEYVQLYNKYVRQYNDMFDTCFKWAVYQDERDKRIERNFENVQKFLDQQAGLLRDIEKKLDKRGGDRS